MQSLESIEQVVRSGESLTVEFKKSTAQLDRAGETLCAFLNTNGGMLLFGVTEEGKVVGQMVSDRTRQAIAETIRRVEPSPYVKIEYIQVSPNQDIIVLQVGDFSAEKPYVYNGRPFWRVESTTLLMPQMQYNKLLLHREHAKTRWENLGAPELQLTDLDTKEIIRTARVGIDNGRLPESGGYDPIDILKRLGLLNDNLITNAAAVLFMKERLSGYPQCTLRLARFRGTSKLTFIDNRILSGNAFLLLDEAMAFLHKHLMLSGSISAESVVREEHLSVPVVALREAVVNALCHREYERADGFISIAIFDDRVEITNSGTLPIGITPDDLKKPHLSRPNNPDIAGVFYRRGLFENWGRGTQLIVQQCKNAKLAEPIFDQTEESFTVLFPMSLSYFARTEQVEPSSDQVGMKTDQVEPKTDQVGIKTDQVEPKTDQVGIKTDQVGLKPDQVGLKTDQVGMKTDQVGMKTDQVGMKTDQVGMKTDQVGMKTDQVGMKTDQVGMKTDQVGMKTDQVGMKTDQVGMKTDQVGIEIIEFLAMLRVTPLSLKEIMEGLGKHHKQTFRQRFLLPALFKELISLTIPDKPNSKNQKYYLTEKGKQVLERISTQNEL